MTTFVPHGLIKTPMQQQMYNQSHTANLLTGIANTKEFETVALMKVVLYRNIFNDDNFAVTSNQPLSVTSARRCNLVVKNLESGSLVVKVLCFCEYERTNTNQDFSLARLESHARSYCELYLEANGDIQSVYAATMVGAYIRLWECDQGGWTPFWGPNDEGDWREYKDIGEDEAGQELERIFDHMKGYPPTPHAG